MQCSLVEVLAWLSLPAVTVGCGPDLVKFEGLMLLCGSHLLCGTTWIPALGALRLGLEPDCSQKITQLGLDCDLMT